MNNQIYNIEIPNAIVSKSFSIALNKKGDFFHNIRWAFKKELEAIFQNYELVVNSSEILTYTNFLKNINFFEGTPIIKYAGQTKDSRIEIDAKFCARYGYDDHSLKAQNYTNGELCDLPSLLSVREIVNFSLGNFLIFIKNKNYKLNIILEDGLNVAGYTYDVSSKKKKSYVCLLGVHYKPDLLFPIFNEFLIDCAHPEESLDEIRVNNAFFPVTFICRRCGKILVCSCFENYLSYKNGLTVQYNDIEVKSGICHLCTGNVPNQIYTCSPMPSNFLIRYMPYHHLFSLKKYGKFVYSQDEGFREIENEVRKRFGYPSIGEKWISETLLYKIVQVIFPSLDVVHHYRGKELEGLEIDVWIPELKLGIEYQGIQHYEVIDHWGGENGLKMRIKNDQKKKIICKSLGYKLIEFRYDENLTEEKIRNRLEYSS